MAAVEPQQSTSAEARRIAQRPRHAPSGPPRLESCHRLCGEHADVQEAGAQVLGNHLKIPALHLRPTSAGTLVVLARASEVPRCAAPKEASHGVLQALPLEVAQRGFPARAAVPAPATATRPRARRAHRARSTDAPKRGAVLRRPARRRRTRSESDHGAGSTHGQVADTIRVLHLSLTFRPANADARGKAARADAATSALPRRQP